MAGSGSRVALEDALDPLVIALDVGSTASRGDVYDAAGRPVAGGRRKLAHQFRSGGDGTSEIDADQIADEVGQLLTDLAAPALRGRVAGVALDTFASSVVGVGADGRAASPCYTYADSRCGRQVTALRSELDEERVQQRTGCRPDQLSEVRDPDRPLTAVGPEVGRRWPALAGARWFPPIADGFASNLGAGADDETTAAVAAATSGAIRVLVPDIPEHIPPGLWCYRVDSRRSLLGGALSDVGRMISWLQDTVQLGGEDPGRLLTAAPDPGTPLVLPYLSGERSTGWAASARAVISGVSTATSGGALFRGAMEGVVLSYARIADQLRTAVGDPRRIMASGRVTQDLPGWLQILADVLGAPVEPVTTKRTTLRGTALHALEVLAPGTARAAVETAPTLRPVAAHRDHYRNRARQYDRLYRAVVARGSPG